MERKRNARISELDMCPVEGNSKKHKSTDLFPDIPAAAAVAGDETDGGQLTGLAALQAVVNHEPTEEMRRLKKDSQRMTDEISRLERQNELMRGKYRNLKRTMEKKSFDKATEFINRGMDTQEAKQQRLILLWHASKCPCKDGECGITACSTWKGVWKHLSGCKKNLCKGDFCMTSKFVLTHYTRCTDEGCVMCSPVKELVRRHKRASMWEECVSSFD